MKRLVYFFAIIWCLLAAPIPSLAHVLQTDGSIGAVMHIDPDDDPIIGQSSQFYFEFKDKTNNFKPSECKCIATISLDGKVTYTQNLFESNSNPSLSNASMSYIFSRKGLYTITVSGEPDNPGAFQPFKLSYDVRVDRMQAGTETGNTNGNLYRAGALIFIALLFIFLLFSNRKRKVSGKKLVIVLILAGSVTLLHVCHSSQLLAQLEHHNHHTSQEHPCCIAQSADVPVRSFHSDPVFIKTDCVFAAINAPNPPVLWFRNTRSPPDSLL